MKKHVSLYLGLIAALFSCNVKEELYESRNGDVVFHAVNADITKTALQSDGSILWNASDKIDILLGSKKFVFTSTNTSAASEVDFKGSLDGVSWDGVTDCWAVYPHADGNVLDGSAVLVSLPEAQTATAGTYAPELFISIAKSTDFNLAFLNVCGGIKFSVSESGIKSVTFKGNSGEPIAGKAKVTFNDSNKPVITEVTEPQTEITLSAPNGTSLEVGKWYYIVCFPTPLQSGYDLVLHKEDGTLAERKNEKPVTIERAMWGRFTEADKNLEYEIPHNEIWYTTTTGQPLGNLSFYSAFGANCISTTYENGQGKLIFDGDVTKIAPQRFWIPDGWTGEDYGVRSISKLIFPSTVKTIEMQAFANLDNLEEMYLPEGLEVIEGYAILSCKKLDNVVIPSTVKEFGYNFSDCPSLNLLSVAEGNEVYDSRENCNAIIETATNTLVSGSNSTVIPNTVTKIDQRAFRNRAIASITIPSSVTEIGNSAFSQCSSLTSIIIPNSVTIIGNSAFSDCSNLASVVLPDKQPTNQMSFAFGNCGLTELTIPNGWTSIPGNEVFYNNNKLTTLSLPDGLETITNGSFSRCSALKSVIIPSSVTSLGDFAFEGCLGLEKITCWANNPPQLGYDALAYTGTCPICVPKDCVDSYKSEWSSHSSRIQAISQPNNEIWYRTESGTSVYVPSYAEFGAKLTSHVYSGGMGIITFDNDVTKINSGVFNYSGTIYISLPSTVTEIGYSAFRNCLIETIHIPDAVTKIGEGAFGYCTQLNKITGKFASEDGHALITTNETGEKTLIAYADSDETSIRLAPDGISVDYIGSLAFSTCPNLKTLYCEVKDYHNTQSFEGCVAEDVTLKTTYSLNLSLETSSGALTEMKKLTILDSEDSYVTYVSGLGWMRKLESITLPKSAQISADYGPMTSSLPIGCKIYGPNASEDHTCWIVNGDLQLFSFPEDGKYYMLPNNVTIVSANIDYYNEDGVPSDAWSTSPYDDSFTMYKGVIIPKTVKSIYSPWCFKMPVIMEGLEPPTISYNFNMHEGRTAHIYVQEYYLDAYKTAWSTFFEEPQYEWEQWNRNTLYLHTYYKLEHFFL